MPTEEQITSVESRVGATHQHPTVDLRPHVDRISPGGDLTQGESRSLFNFPRRSRLTTASSQHSPHAEACSYDKTFNTRVHRPHHPHFQIDIDLDLSRRSTRTVSTISGLPHPLASKTPQPLGLPSGYPTDPTAFTMTGDSWCPLFPAGPTYLQGRRESGPKS